jgi:hypothetical protein
MIGKFKAIISAFFSHKLGGRYFLSAFLLSSVLFGSVLAILPISYETIDDFFMNSIASGYFGGTPDEHLIYTHFLIGLVLKTLFTFLSSFNWYAAYLLTALFIGFCALSWLLLKRMQTFFALSFILYFFLVYYINFIMQLQFTTASGSLAIAGVLVLLEQLYSGDFKINRKMIFSVGMILFAGMIRHTSAFMVMILLAPFFLVLPFNFKTNLRSLGVYISVISLLSLTHFSDRRYYTSNSQWNQYLEHFAESSPYNDNRTFWSDFYFHSERPYLNLGWSQNDLVLFTAFFRDFDPVYNHKAFMQIKSVVSQAPYYWKEFWNDLFYKFRSIHLYVLMLFTLLILPVKQWIKPVMIIASVVFIIWYINISLHVKERVLYIIYMGISLSLVLILTKYQGQNFHQFVNNRIKKYIFLALIVFIWGLGLNSARNSFKHSRSTISKAREEFRQKLDFCDRNKYLIFWGASLNFESLNPFENSFNFSSQPKVYSISAFAKSPLYNVEFKSKGANSFIELLPKKDVEIIGYIDKDSTSDPRRLQLFYKQHLGIELLTLYHEQLESVKLRKYAFKPPDSRLPD